MGEPMRGGKAGPSSRDEKLRRERGQKLEDRSLCTKKYKKKKILARKKRRRGRAGRRSARRQASNDRDRVRRRELVIATHNVRTRAVDGKHGKGRAAEVLYVYQEMGCDISVCRQRGVAASLLFIKLDYVVFSAAVSPEATGKERRAKVELDWLFTRVFPVPKHDRRSSSATGY